MEDKLFKATKKVVEDWGIVEAVFFVIFFPISLAYLLFRIFQEYD